MSLFLLSLPILGSASPALWAEIGLGGYVVRWNYAPVRVSLSGIDRPIDGEIRLVQLIGNPAEDPAEVDHVLYAGKISDRRYEATVPIYDPLNRVRIEVRDVGGGLIASDEADLRLKRRIGPFPAVCGIRISPSEDAVFIDPSELPRDWWGFDPVKRLWIGGPGAADEGWTTIGSWVTAGGSVVIFTGSDFYRFDTPALRRLIPIVDPCLATGPDGTEYLTGVLRPGARIAVERDGIPLLIIGGCGAGAVSLVALRPDQVSEAELAAIVARAPTSRSLDAAPVAEEVLRETRVDRPSFLAALFLVAAVLAGFLWFARRIDTRPRAGTVVVLLLIAGLTVASGLYINRTKQPVWLYAIKLELSIEDAFGIKVGWYALYANEAGSAGLAGDRGSYLIQSALLSLAAATYAAESEPEGTRIDLLPQERRDLAYYGRATPSIAFAFDGDSATIDNRSGEPIDGGLIAVGGVAYPLPPIPPGQARIPLTDGRDLRLYESGYPALDLVVRRFEGRLGLDRGEWLIAVRSEERVEPDEESARKVRDLRIRLIRGGYDAGP